MDSSFRANDPVKNRGLFLFLLLLSFSFLFADLAAATEDAPSDISPTPNRAVTRDAASSKAAPAEEAKFAASLYADSVSQKVLRVMTNWPKTDDGMRLTGEVMVQITIAEDGSLIEVTPRMATGENSAKMGSDIIQKVSAAAPFLPPPKSTLNKLGRFQFLRTFTYSINKEWIPKPNARQPRLW